MIKLLSLILTIISTSAAVASTPPDEMYNVRALGMGGSYTAVVDDADSLFYNPAGIARHSGFGWRVFDPHVGINGVETIQQIQSVTSNSGDMADALNALYGKRIWAGGGVQSAVLVPGLAIGGFATTEAGMYLQNPANTTMNLNYFVDYGVALGTGFDFIPSIMKVGLVAKRINRTGTTLPLGPSVLATLDPDQLQSEFKRRGTGYSMDFGTVFTIPGPVAPAISFVYRNMGYTQFSHEEGAGAPPRIEPEMIAGASFKVDAGLISIIPSIDYRFMNRNDMQIGNKLHLGVELGLPLIDLRAGFNQGYYTAGVGLNMGILRLDAATYGVELGEYPGQLEDRRYVAQITFELGFDPGLFGFGSSSSGGSGSGSNGKPGERRRLKQRR